MDEFECMRLIGTTLESMDTPARGRITAWMSSKYGDLHISAQASQQEVIGAPSAPQHDGQIPGIAKLSQTGELQITIRDVKARSANDAAIRLVHVAIWALEELKGESSVSSKGVLVPLLRRYRCYDGNTRSAIANDKGLIRDGDQLSLDFHAKQMAEKFAKEICDVSTEGIWRPGATKRRVSRASRSHMSGGLSDGR